MNQRRTLTALTGGLDIELSVLLQTQQMRRDNMPVVPLTNSNAKHLYWTPAQIVAHHASGGCNLRSGDLIGSGTISGPAESQRGSLLELTAGGNKTIELPNGEVRSFLEDGMRLSLVRPVVGMALLRSVLELASDESSQPRHVLYRIRLQVQIMNRRPFQAIEHAGVAGRGRSFMRLLNNGYSGIVYRLSAGGC